MLIEIILDNIGMVGGIRHGWKPWAKNKPNPRLVFEIRKQEFPKLVNFLAGRPITFGTPEKHDASFGHRLYLTALDIQNPLTRHDHEFFESVLTK